jgi:hypothetical protein
MTGNIRTQTQGRTSQMKTFWKGGAAGAVHDLRWLAQPAEKSLVV